MNSPPAYRISFTDVFWVLFLVAWTAFGVAKVFDDVAEYRAEQAAIAAFNARMPQMIGKAPYDHAVGERLIDEAAGAVATLAVVFFGLRRRRRRVVEARVKWIETPAARAAAEPKQVVTLSTQAPPSPRARTAQAGSLAAARLSAAVWNDHVARLEEEVA